MKTSFRAALLGALLISAPATLLADDIEGRIQAIDPASQSFVVQGITFYTTPSTDYDDGLRSFADLAVGLKVEVDFTYLDGRHIATEVELDD